MNAPERSSLHDRPLRLSIAVTFRFAQADDLPLMEWFGQYTHFRSVYRATFRDQQAGKRFMLLAVANGFPIGQVFGHWQHIPAVFAPAQRSAPAQTMRLYLYSLRVLDMFQGMGIGTSLLTTCEAMARERRARALGIAAAKDNPRARALYERVGYCVIGQDDGRWSYVDHTGRTCTVDEPCWVLEKSLRIG